MSKSTTTLKQIAETAGVSITTVHRVMNGKEGCGEELRRRIMEIAKQQGYEANYVASSLRKKPVHIALIFPKGDADSHFYVQEILNGYFQEREEIEHYNIIFQEYYYPAYDMGSTAFLNFLNNIYQEIIYVFLTIFLYLLKCPQSLILSALRAFCFCGK
ncbi:MAG: LacI family DNA-binding transcriptional regulator, partial [Clostridiales bacterium]|nr:LacI family DNA-binding transcriptional regulator [Clostridiales bacterium]